MVWKVLVSLRQMGGTIEVSSAFQNKQIAGAVTSSLRVDGSAQPRLLLKLEDLGFFYSMDVIAHARGDLKKYPQVVEGMVRAYTEGVAAMHFQKERASAPSPSMPVYATRKRLTKFTRIRLFTWKGCRGWSRNRSLRYSISWAKKDVPLETFADNSIVEKMVREGFIDKLYKKS